MGGKRTFAAGAVTSLQVGKGGIGGSIELCRLIPSAPIAFMRTVAAILCGFEVNSFLVNDFLTTLRVFEISEIRSIAY
jgi:hypothetical protein